MQLLIAQHPLTQPQQALQQPLPQTTVQQTWRSTSRIQMVLKPTHVWVSVRSPEPGRRAPKTIVTMLEPPLAAK